MENITELLKERGKTHGAFSTNASVSQDIKNILCQQGGWDYLTQVQKEALDMIATKIARIMSGNPHEVDHWQDIQGYAGLVLEDLNKHTPPISPEYIINSDDDIPF